MLLRYFFLLVAVSSSYNGVVEGCALRFPEVFPTEDLTVREERGSHGRLFALLSCDGFALH
jgi:hypothetical protein